MDRNEERPGPRGIRGLVRRIRILDDEVFLALAGSHQPVLDAVMPRLTRAADHSVLWLGTAAFLTVGGDRRSVHGAWRGVAAIGVASLLANQVGKREFGRTRPVIDHVPRRRRPARIPESTSFPSGHAASAAAFATAVSLARPRLAPALVPLALAVGFSRVYTGVHHPSDVVAGLALGAGVSTVGAVVRPLAATRPRRTVSRTPVDLPGRLYGDDVVVVVNPVAGGGTAEAAARALVARLPRVRLVVPAPGESVADALRAVAPTGVVAVCGGDGTANAAAAVALELERPLLVVPGGTFNHFASDLGIGSVADAAEALRSGSAARIDMGTIETDTGAEWVFLNTASIGAYPDFVRIRQRLANRLGGPVAAAIASVLVWRGSRPVAATVGGRSLRLAALFVGNGRYSPGRDLPQWRHRLDDGLLDVRYLDADSWSDLLASVTRLLTGRIGASQRYVAALTDGVEVSVHAGPERLTCDGEVRPPAAHLRFRVRPDALTVYACPGRRT